MLARNSARPVLNPVITLSEIKLTTAPALTSHARNAIKPTKIAEPAASAPKRDVSPPEISPSEAPTSIEMAEVTVMMVCRELQNTQNTRPLKRQA